MSIQKSEDDPPLPILCPEPKPPESSHMSKISTHELRTRKREEMKKKKKNGMTCKGEVTCVLIHISKDGNKFIRVLEHLSS